jgi:hypothetical protein
VGQAALDQVLEIIKDLSRDDLCLVAQAVRKRLQPQDEAAAEEAFLQSLLEKGVISEIRRLGPEAFRERPLVPIQGEPLSETIIRERR